MITSITFSILILVFDTILEQAFQNLLNYKGMKNCFFGYIGWNGKEIVSGFHW